jgi:hypothetical protein
MREASSANLEMAIILPLGVVANQLMRIEADLRLLNMKALDFAKERENEHVAGRIEATLENINGTLESIRDLVSDIEGCIQPRSTYATDTVTMKHISQVDSQGPMDDTRSSSDVVYSHANRKPHPDRDD